MAQRNCNLPIQIILAPEDDLTNREEIEDVIIGFLTNTGKPYSRVEVQVKSDPNDDPRTLHLRLWRKDAYRVDFVEICLDKEYNVLSVVERVSIGV